MMMMMMIVEAVGNQVLATSPRQNSGSIAAHGLARIRMGGSSSSHHHHFEYYCHALARLHQNGRVIK